MKSDKELIEKMIKALEVEEEKDVRFNGLCAIANYVFEGSDKQRFTNIIHKYIEKWTFWKSIGITKTHKDLIRGRHYNIDAYFFEPLNVKRRIKFLKAILKMLKRKS